MNSDRAERCRGLEGSQTIKEMHGWVTGRGVVGTCPPIRRAINCLFCFQSSASFRIFSYFQDDAPCIGIGYMKTIYNSIRYICEYIRYNIYVIQERICWTISSKKSIKKNLYIYSRGPIEGTVEIHIISERRRFSSTFIKRWTISRRDSIYVCPIYIVWISAKI